MKSKTISSVRSLITLLPLYFPSLALAQPPSGPVSLPGSVPRAAAAPSVARIVDCNVGQTIQDAVNVSWPGDAILVSGNCNENVTITEQAVNVILDGQGNATISGADARTATVVVRGRDVTIKGFTITGTASGAHGVTITRGGSAIIDENIIQNVKGSGINVTGHSSARIMNNTVQNNDEDGIIVNETSSRASALSMWMR